MAHFGRIRLGKITNNTRRKLHFHNPWRNVSGVIAAGLSESGSCNGYLPSWNDVISRKYEISYYSEEMQRTKTMLIEEKDEYNWILGIHEVGGFRDGCDVTPPWDYNESIFQIEISDFGYEIYCNLSLKGRRISPSYSYYANA